MTRKELENLRKLIKDEMDSRKEFNITASSNDVVDYYERLNKIKKYNEFIELIREDKKYGDYLDLFGNNVYTVNEEYRSILADVLKDFKVTKSNGIYVCTGSYRTDCHISYQDTDYYTRKLKYGDPSTEYRMYSDIELDNRKKVYSASYKNEMSENYEHSTYNPTDNWQLIDDFERSNIVLDPKKTSLVDYEDIKLDFFETECKQGQAKAKRLILDRFG